MYFDFQLFDSYLQKRVLFVGVVVVVVVVRKVVPGEVNIVGGGLRK